MYDKAAEYPCLIHRQTRDNEKKQMKTARRQTEHVHIPTACTWCTQLCCSYEAMLNAADGRRDRAGFRQCSSRTERVLRREQSTNRSCTCCWKRSRRTRKSEASCSCPDPRKLLPVCAPQNTAESGHLTSPKVGARNSGN